ncbi:MAG: hypothetical protein MK137_05950 [Rickettsiales bacterium]|nr:hypothetical protein [Rickettsiales bacterium]
MNNHNSPEENKVDTGPVIAFIVFVVIVAVFYLVLKFTSDTDTEVVIDDPAEVEQVATNVTKTPEASNVAEQSRAQTQEELLAIRAKAQDEKYQTQATELELKAKEAKAREDLLGFVRAYTELIDLHASYLRYDRSIELLKELAELAIQTEQYQNAAESYNRAAYYYMIANNGESASKYYQKALDMVKKTNNVNDIAYMHHNIGQSYLLNKEYQKASQAFLEALFIHRENKNFVNAVETLNALATTHHLAGRLDEALLFQVESFNLNVNNDRPGKIIEDYLSIGAIYHDMNDKANACKSLSEGYKMIYDKEVNYQGNRAMILERYNKVMELAECGGTMGSFGME